MQVAGSSCFVCGRNIATAREAVGCAACQIVGHAACTADAACPTCGGRLVAGLTLDKPEPPADIALRLDRVRGWLAFFVIQVTILAVFSIVSAAMVLYSGFVNTDWRSLAAGLFLLGMGVYAGYCQRLLWGRDPSAPKHAQWLLGVYATGLVAIGAVMNHLNGAGKGLIWWLVWGIYLTRSRRVAAVYGKAQA